MDVGGRLRSIPAASLAAGLLLVLAAPTSASPQRATGAPPVTVRAVIWPNLKITVAPASFKAGQVTFVVKNRDSHPHQFSVNGVTWPKIKPHGSGTMTVTFKKPTVYSITLPDYFPAPNTRYVLPGGSLKVTRR